MQVFHHSHLLTGARWNAKLELHHVAFLGQLDFLNLVERLDAALHLRRFGGMRFKAIDETLLFCQHRLLTGEGRLLIGLANGPLTLVKIVIAGVRDDLAGIDLRDLGHQPVHEFAVVRSHQERAWKGLEKLFQPDDGFDIEVVGGLIHQEDIGPSEEHAGQRHAHFPSARKRADVAVDLVVRKAETMQYLARLRLEGVTAQVLVLFLHLAESSQRAIQAAGLRRIFHGVLQGF